MDVEKILSFYYHLKDEKNFQKVHVNGESRYLTAFGPFEELLSNLDEMDKISFKSLRKSNLGKITILQKPGDPFFPKEGVEYFLSKERNLLPTHVECINKTHYSLVEEILHKVNFDGSKVKFGLKNIFSNKRKIVCPRN